MKSSIKKLSTLLFAVLSLAIAIPAYANIEQDRAEGLAWLLKNQNGDGSWGQAGAKVAVTSEVLEALHQSGVGKGASYSRALSWLANIKAGSVDALARKIIALEHVNFDTQAMGMVDDLLARRNTRSGWGSFDGYDSGFPDTSLAIRALFATQIVYADLAVSISRITAAQKAGDFGWSYMGDSLGTGFNSKIMPTAHNLMTLSEHYQMGGGGLSRITRGINWLIQSKRQVDGSFLDDTGVATGQVQQTALAYLAINAASTVGISPTGSAVALVDAQTYLLTQQLGNGSWNNDAHHTALALRTFPITSLLDTDLDGVPDSVESIVGTNPTIADVRGLISSNGLNPDGLENNDLSADVILLEVIVGSSFTHTPILAGGTAAYAWSQGNGSLPEGVTLQSSTTGRLGGTPSSTGIYSFSLLVEDSLGAKAIVPGSIRVVAAADRNTDTDGDGLWSSFELANGSDPLDAGSTTNASMSDSDGDGLPDSWEITYGQLDPNIDSDGDSLTNIVEYQLGTNPFGSDGPGPELVTDSVTVEEDGFIAFNVLANDAASVDASTITVPTGSTRGVLVNNSNGDFSYQPSANFFGSDFYIYRVCGFDGLCSSTIVNITITSVNDVPTADAGTDQSVDEQTIVSLNGSGADSDGSIASYAWSQTSGTAVTLSGATTANASFTAPVVLSSDGPQVLTFELITTDNEVSSGIADSISIRVDPMDAAPTVTIHLPLDNSNYTLGETITFAASASDTEDGDISADIGWESDLDGEIGSGANFSLSTLSVGSHIITASVTDSAGFSPVFPPSITLTIVPFGPVALDPLEDGYVRAGAFENVPYGVEDPSLLWIKLSGLDYTRQAYLRFDLRDANRHVVEAKVRFKVKGVDDGAKNSLSPVSDNIWDEDTLTWANKPSYSPSFGTKTIPSEGEWVEWDVTNHINTLISKGADYVSYMLDSHSYNLSAKYHSSESSPADRPKLELTFNNNHDSDNNAPTAEIFEPLDGGSFTEGGFVVFSGSALDSEDGDISARLSWLSNIDGFIGSGANFSLSSLSEGVHIITATVVDNGGLSSISLPSITLAIVSLETIALEPLVDAYVRDGAYANIAYGVEDPSVLLVKISGTGYNRRAYLRFDLRDVSENVTDAKIRLKVKGVTDGAKNSLRPVSDNTWDEESLTWANKPNFLASLGTKTIPNKNEWVEWDVTSHINALINSGADYSSYAVVSNTQAYNLFAKYYSSESNAADRPKLELTFDGNLGLTGFFTPIVSISSPADNSSYTLGDSIFFAGTAIDNEDGDISGGLVWSSNLDGFLGASTNFSLSALSQGTHTITATVVDSDGLSPLSAPEVTLTINVGGDTPPVTSITAPSDGSSYSNGDTIIFMGSATDAEDGDISGGLVWTSDRDGVVGTGSSFSLSTLSVGSHTITAMVMDSGGFNSPLPPIITVTVAP